MSAQPPVSAKAIGRLLLIGVLGTVLALVLAFGATAAAFAFPGRRSLEKLGFLLPSRAP